MSDISEKTEKTENQENFLSNDTTEIRRILRHVRDSLVELFVALAKTLFFWIPGGDVARGKALMACHPIFITFIAALFFVVKPHSPIRFMIVVLAVVTVASQWLLGGCVVTRAEQRLTGSNETILDPFLILAGLSVNRDTCIAATIGSGTAICAILIWALACDLFPFRLD